jgi:hypothetical protein
MKYDDAACWFHHAATRMAVLNPGFISSTIYNKDLVAQSCPRAYSCLNDLERKQGDPRLRDQFDAILGRCE